ncbi:MAG: YggS family pyridoxal phosphate-dependent enzyme [Bacteroidota bacterium]
MHNTVSRDSTSTIQQRIAGVLRRMEQACQRVGRDASEVELVAVTKTYPIEVVREAFDAGIRHFGENRVQELKLKSQALPGVQHGGEVFWHMIGHVQRNKAKDVLECADFVHALDSQRLAEVMDRRAGDKGRVLPCLVQVNVSNEYSKFGLEPADVPEFLVLLKQYANLEVRGFMTLAAPAADPEDVRPQFKLLRSIMHDAQQAHPQMKTVDVLSMGMSGDFEVAIEEGATHVRVGSALFGARS